MKNAMLELQYFNVTEISFGLNKSYKSVQEPIEINPLVSRKIVKLDSDTAAVIIKLEIKNDSNKPFLGHIVLQGTFKCHDWEKTEDSRFLVNETTSAILFPYLRQTLTQITSILNVTPYVLPIVNTIELFKNSK